MIRVLSRLSPGISVEWGVWAVADATLVVAFIPGDMMAHSPGAQGDAKREEEVEQQKMEEKSYLLSKLTLRHKLPHQREA